VTHIHTYSETLPINYSNNSGSITNTKDDRYYKVN